MRAFKDFLDEENEISPVGDNQDQLAEGGPMTTPEEAAASMGATGRRPLSTAPSMTPNDLPRVRAVPQSSGSEQKDKYTPGLAFMAAFSHNPVLQQMLHDEVQAPERRAAKAQAQALAAEDLGRKRAKEGRESAEFAAKQPYLADMAKAGIDSKGAYADLTKQKAIQAREEGDPTSDLSKGASASAAQSLQAQAELVRPKNAMLADQLTKAAQAMTGKSVRAAREILGTLSKIAPQVMKSVNDDFDNSMAKDASARGWSGQAETKRHNEATEALGENKMQLTLLKPQEKLNKEISGLDFALSAMKQAGELKKDVNTGKYVQTLADFTNNWISSDLTSDKRKELGAVVARVFNKERHELAGSAVSPSEFAVIEPQIPSLKDDDSLFMTKLTKAIELTNDLLSKKRAEYQRGPGGMPVDKSNTARKATGQKPVLTPEETSGSADSEAVKWAKANPGDPRAKKILEMNGVK